MTLTITQGRRRDRLDIRQDVKDCCKLGALKWVLWHIQTDVSGDMGFPDWVNVRFVDQAGQEAELVFHGNLDSKGWMESDILALNQVLNHFNLLPDGKIVGVNWEISEAVNYARKQYPGISLECPNGQICF